MPLDDVQPVAIRPFVVRLPSVVRVETEDRIEASRWLLKETNEMAKGYKPTVR